MPKKIPYLTLEQYRTLYENFLKDEEKDLEPSETILGDSYYESPVKVVFEHVLLTHMRVSGAVPIKKPNLCYARKESHKYEEQTPEYIKTYPSVSVFLKKVLDQGGWFEELKLEHTTKERQFHFANVVIFLANLLLG
ncbi:MAG: hypothetical protein NTZ13_01435 [Candidatus Parcubacteria bacterium]|nr:hypothetical protein [Candidatus Parcubacteria bacterium]